MVLMRVTSNVISMQDKGEHNLIICGTGEGERKQMERELGGQERGRLSEAIGMLCQ